MIASDSLRNATMCRTTMQCSKARVSMLIDAEDWPESNWQAGGKDIHMVLMPFAPEILAVDGVGSRELLSLKCRMRWGRRSRSWDHHRLCAAGMMPRKLPPSRQWSHLSRGQVEW